MFGYGFLSRMCVLLSSRIHALLYLPQVNFSTADDSPDFFSVNAFVFK